MTPMAKQVTARDFIDGVRNCWLIGETFLEADVNAVGFVVPDHPDKTADVIHCYVRENPEQSGLRISLLFVPGRFSDEDMNSIATHFSREIAYENMATLGAYVTGNNAACELQIGFLRFMMSVVGNGEGVDHFYDLDPLLEKWPDRAVLRNMLASI